MRNIDSYHRKGSVYVYVLSVALLITGIGLSSLWAMRVQRRVAGVGEAVVQARVAAGSFLDVALLRIANNPSWRSAYTHDVWVANETVHNVSYTFKLVDEQDADLANDDTQLARLYAKATVGDAVRIYSVLLRPDDATGGNLLSNGDMENGLTPWSSMECDLDIDANEPHGGAACLWVNNRGGQWDGPRQDIAGQIIEGTTYDVRLWVKLKDFSENVRLVLWMDTSLDYYPVYYAQQSVGTTWTQVGGIVAPTWEGELLAAYWEVETAWSSQEYKIDDAIMRPPRSASVVPGSWRREVLP
ncbi:MAG: hypothetical protein AMJ65_13465 [Phycisphaerae bacterium SG8_4]|nr:MAG: hypothetical protein AMJ65_13465 [Phycisphaerae bacterium SG8_4]